MLKCRQWAEPDLNPSAQVDPPVPAALIVVEGSITPRIHAVTQGLDLQVPPEL